jgi:hypothetical protein
MTGERLSIGCQVTGVDSQEPHTCQSDSPSAGEGSFLIFRNKAMNSY